MLKPSPLKIIAFTLDQVKQVDPMALYIDIVQGFFCLGYIYRMVCLKCMVTEPGPIEGYSKKCSILTDFCVIIFYLIKCLLSQLTNWHNIEDILNDNHKGHD
jgi:hypothetical protein